jgi:hypothetical protein
VFQAVLPVDRFYAANGWWVTLVLVGLSGYLLLSARRAFWRLAGTAAR